ncbi:Cof-type HAD-IIB family hydrolase [Bacillaceae bacterium]
MNYKIVFFDIDGTLMNEEKMIPADTKEAVHRLKKKGIYVALATGRAPFHLREIAEELAIDSYVCFNGSYVVCQDRPIYARPLERETLAALEKRANAHRHPLVYLSHAECYANREDHPHVIESFHALRLAAPGFHPHYWQEEPIYQALLYCQAHEEKGYRERFSELTFIRWHKFSLDVLPADGSKAKGIAVMLEHLGFSPAEAVAFGDGLNDKEMLAFVGAGVAMGNAHEEVKPFAAFTTKGVDEGGISYGLEKIGLLP